MAEKFSIQKIAIVGAGWNGLQMAKVFVDCGYEVKVFEKMDDVGGTWHPSIAYVDLGIHSSLFTCEFEDFEDSVFTQKHSRHRRAYGRDMFRYIRSFAEKFDLISKISFETEIVSIDYLTAAKQCKIEIKKKRVSSTSFENFDFVISTQFNEANLPSIPGEDIFRGKIYHSRDLLTEVFDEIIAQNQKVVLVGGSKSAVEHALSFIRRNFSFEWLMREMYWFICFDAVFYDLDKNRLPNFFRRLLYWCTTLLNTNRLTMMIFGRLWRMLGLMLCPGQKHSNYNKCHLGTISKNEYEWVNSFEKKNYGEIFSLAEGSIQFSTGKNRERLQSIDCDVLILATGSNNLRFPIKLSKDGVGLDYHQMEFFKNSIPFDIPILHFAGMSLSLTGPSAGYNRAGWLLYYFEKINNAEWMQSEHKRNVKRKLVSLFAARKRSHLFDSSSNFFHQRVKNLLTFCFEDIVVPLDLAKLYFSLLFKHKNPPLGKTKEFIDKIARERRLKLLSEAKNQKNHQDHNRNNENNKNTEENEQKDKWAA